jgi:transcriptional regulator with XRE-family HTH domain
MDNQEEVRAFLSTRRERLTPEQAGLPFYGSHRRVKGLRREEVATLAGMSTDYYTRLERGNLSGVSAGVLEALSRALHLDEAERAHLFNLADGANTGVGAKGPAANRARRGPSRAPVRPGIQRILDTINAPAYVRNGRMDILAVNRLGRALYADAYGKNAPRFNLAQYIFLDPRSRDFYVRWEPLAGDTVAALRAEAGRNPYDRGLTDLIGELSTQSAEFRSWWAAHDVKFHRTVAKKFHHSVVGDLELTGEALVLPGDPGLTLITYTVEPGSPSEEALGFLDSWAGQDSVISAEQERTQ